MRSGRAAAVLLGFSLFAASSGITSAYLTDYPETIRNLVTAGSVDVKLEEPAWDPGQAEGLTPGSAVPKNPLALNSGKNDAWIFLRVFIPIKHISLVDPESRRKKEPADTEIFCFTVGDAWEQIERTEENGIAEYVYGYRELVAPGQRTEPLFEQVELVNYLEGELTAEEILELPVEAVAVQDHVCPEGAELTEIYHIYSSQ